MMEGNALLPLPEGLRITALERQDTVLIVEVLSERPQAACPLCQQPSEEVHSRYHRQLKDVPCGGQQVRLHLKVRKFFCRNHLCERKIFTERLPNFVEPYAQMTLRLIAELQAIGFSTSGSLGARLASRLGIGTSWMTILRRLLDLPDQTPATVFHLGIDEFAFRRGYQFGTLLVNLESHRVVDLLPDKRVETAAAWMRQHPDIQIVSRDRGGEFASAARLGAPQAIQCADRFHVVKNLTEALQPLLARCQAEILSTNPPPDDAQLDSEARIVQPTEWRPNVPAHVQRVQAARRAERSARYQQAVELSRQGKSAEVIGSQLGVTGRTVKLWLTKGIPNSKRRRRRPGSFESYAPYVLSRWQAGERNGLAIYREIKAQGYNGSERTVYRYLEPLKQAEVQASVDVYCLRKVTVNTAIWLFIRDRKSLSDLEKRTLEMFCLASSPLALAYRLVQQFLTLVRKREGHGLDEWLRQVVQSGIPELQSFASGIEKDKEAVQAGLSLWINNGMVEGHVTKLKLIKRQGYGRAGFRLLRQRVLHAM